MSLNPHKLKVIEQGYIKKQKENMKISNIQAHLYGSYVVEALQATVCNMFLKKGATPYKYPEKPREIDERTEKQKKDDALKAFIHEQDEMRRLWKKAHKQGGTE